MSNVKHAPATPLPWTMDQSSYVYGYYQGDGALESRTILGPAPLPKADRDYVLHAANAYPKLVEALKALKGCVYFGDADTLECDKHAALRASALLRSIGEDA